jgi:type II secretion system protein J
LDEALIRGYWRHVDRAFDAEPVQQTLLEGVDRIEFYALEMNGNEHTFWPVPGVAPGDPSIRLAGVMVRIEVKPFGTIERIWEVPDV